MPAGPACDPSGVTGVDGQIADKASSSSVGGAPPTERTHEGAG